MAQEFIEITNLSEFDFDLQTLANLPAEQSLLFQKKIALELFKRIIEKTPVGNPELWAPQSLPPPEGYVGGRARGNWQMSVISPDFINADISDDLVEFPPDASGTPTELVGIANIRAAKPFETIWIFNNLPYITALEEGHSTQAPFGMVSLSIAEIQSGLV